MGAPTTNTQRLAHWLRNRAHSEFADSLRPRSVRRISRAAGCGRAGEEPAQGKELAQGSDVGLLRRRAAPRARAASWIGLHALTIPRAGAASRLEQLAETAAVDVGKGSCGCIPHWRGTVRKWKCASSGPEGSAAPLVEGSPTSLGWCSNDRLGSRQDDGLDTQLLLARAPMCRATGSSTCSCNAYFGAPVFRTPSRADSVQFETAVQAGPSAYTRPRRT